VLRITEGRRWGAWEKYAFERGFSQ
jgi:hypothetical protein